MSEYKCVVVSVHSTQIAAIHEVWRQTIYWTYFANKHGYLLDYVHVLVISDTCRGQNTNKSIRSVLNLGKDLSIHDNFQMSLLEQRV